MPNYGNTGTPSQTYSYTQFGTSNELAINLASFPASGGVISSVSGYIAGKSGSATLRAVIMDSSGNVLAQSGSVSSASGSGGVGGQRWTTISISYTFLPNANLYIGFWRDPSTSFEWTEQNGGTEYFANTGGSVGNVLTASGHYSASGSPAFYVTYSVPAPSISGISPTSGNVGNGVTISGANFTGATSVAFNGTGVGYTVNSDSNITTSVPSGATTGAISVTTPSGTGYSNTFTVTLLPSISGLSATSGNAGDSIIITGNYFSGASSVTFNGTGASYAVNSNTQITTTVPVGATTGTISVSNTGGTGYSGTFTVTTLPSVSSLSPSSGNAGTSVVVTGNGFTGVSSVAFNGTTASYTVNSNTQITTTVPVGATTGTISVSNTGGTGYSGTFTVTTLPTISSISPTIGGPGTSVVILGGGYTGTTAVTFNGTSATYVVNSSGQITATVPNGATVGPISVTNSGGTAYSATFTPSSYYVSDGTAWQAASVYVSDGTTWQLAQVYVSDGTTWQQIA